MILRKMAVALLVLGTVGAAIPSFADDAAPAKSLATPVTNGNMANGTNTGSGNGSNGQVGDNPDNANGMTCFTRDKAGSEAQFTCPTDMKMMPAK